MSFSGKDRFYPILIHIIVWVILFAIPTLVLMENPELGKFSMRIYAMLVGLFITFYSNLLWAGDKLLFKRRYVLFVLFNIVLFLLVREIYDKICHFFLDPRQIHRPHHFSHAANSLFFFNEVVFFLLSVGASLGIRYAALLHDVEIKHKKLENETLTSELSLLKYQIQPHFFFNSLNNIYSLIGSSPVKAQKEVHSLSKMMRYILYDSSNQTIPLQHEIVFLTNYISLMKLRLKSDAQASFHFPSNIGEIFIPPLIFIPLIENAFKHGIGPMGEASIECRMALSDTAVTFCVRNTVYKVDNDDKSNSGIGLANLKKRLDILYGDKHHFSASRSETDNVFEAVVSIPILSK